MTSKALSSVFRPFPPFCGIPNIFRNFVSTAARCLLIYGPKKRATTLHTSSPPPKCISHGIQYGMIKENNHHLRVELLKHTAGVNSSPYEWVVEVNRRLCRRFSELAMCSRRQDCATRKFASHLGKQLTSAPVPVLLKRLSMLQADSSILMV